MTDPTTTPIPSSPSPGGGLDQIQIASPCTQDWDAMTGDARRRYCGECRLHVHDLSEMTRREAEELLRGADGRVCVRLYRRPDGRVLTKDCVTVRERLQRRLRRLRVAAAALFALVTPFASACGAPASPPAGSGATTTTTPPEEYAPLMGDVCMPEELGELEIVPTRATGERPPAELGRVGPTLQPPAEKQPPIESEPEGGSD